jgi:hypothetical protein
MATFTLILFVIQIILINFAARNESETWNFQTTILTPIEYCICSTCISSDARKIGVTFDQYVRRLD